MRGGLFDLPSGISGDMFLGALVGAGASFEAMRSAVRAVAGDELSLERAEVLRGGVAGTRIEVCRRGEPIVETGGPIVEETQGPPPSAGDSHAHHPYPGVIARIEGAGLAESVRERALAVFRLLGDAEARVHGVTPREVHFHEVGSLDAIADVVGAAAGLDSLGLGLLRHGPIAVGGGTGRIGHGVAAFPAPATLELLRGRPCVFEEGAGELTTPTGAALLAALAEPAPPGFSLRPERIGYGAGRIDASRRPNLARLTIGDVDPAPSSRNRVAVVEASLDDATPEEGGHLLGALFAAGALDVSLTPIIMKKGRPGFLLRVLCPPEEGAAFAERIVALSPSLGARWRVEERIELERREDRVRLGNEEVRVKVAVLPDGGVRPHPEYEDLARVAAATGRPFHEVRDEALRAWRKGGD